MSGGDRSPRVEVRRRRRKDGTVSKTPTVRYINSRGERKRLTCSTIEEADLERTPGARAQPRPGARADGDADGGGLLADLPG